MTHRTGTIAQQLERVETELAEARENELLNGFYEEVAQKVLFAAQCRPFEEWPELLQLAFKHVEREQPTTGAIARRRLPK
jgi:hypothetical protein